MKVQVVSEIVVCSVGGDEKTPGVKVTIKGSGKSRGRGGTFKTVRVDGVPVSVTVHVDRGAAIEDVVGTGLGEIHRVLKMSTNQIEAMLYDGSDQPI